MIKETSESVFNLKTNSLVLITILSLIYNYFL